jgi:Phospholipase_D-nuclease N-terminal
MFGMAALGGWEIALIVVGLLCVAFWVWMIVDCALYETSAGTRAVWLLVIILGWMIGAPLYYIARKFPRYFVKKPSVL